VEEFNAAGVRCVVVDPATGEILAMADVVRTPPDAQPFSAEALRSAHASGRFVRFRTMKEDPGREVHPSLGRNRCVEDVYEPGSTFKPFVWAAITERGLARPAEMVDTHGGSWRTPYGRLIEDVVPLERQSWFDVLVNSSNIGMSQMVTRVPFHELRKDLVTLGFGAKTGIGLPGEASGLLTRPKDWTHYTQTSVSFGYEVAVTPVQMARAFAAFARPGERAGTVPSVTLRAEVGAVDAPAVRVYSADTAERAREAMSVVAMKMAERAAKRFKDDPPMRYTLFGKSGTSEMPRPGMRGYFDRQYTSSFVAGAPLANPRIVVVVVVDDPGPELRDRLMHYGSSTAGPILVRIARRTLEYMGEVPDLPDPNAEADLVAGVE
jgi:cell division protein FtsI (penicillin-binding protein 3)